MSFHTWWLYMITTCVVSAIPGPNMLFVMTIGARHGLRRASWAMPGCLIALVIMQAVSAAGLGTVLKAWPLIFNALRFAGAGYMIYLGIKSWLAEPAPADPTQQAQGAAQIGRFTLCRSGFLVGASNPKAMVFAGALLPQFLNPAAPILPQILMLLATFAVFEVIWYLIYAAFGLQLQRYMHNRRVIKVFNRLTGGVFVAFGVLMASEHR